TQPVEGVRHHLRTRGHHDLLRRRVPRNCAGRRATRGEHPAGPELHGRPAGVPSRSVLRARARYRKPDVRDRVAHRRLAAHGAGRIAELRPGFHPHAERLPVLARRHPGRGPPEPGNAGHRRPQSRDHPQQPDDGHGAAAQRQPEHARDAQGSRGAGTVIRVRPTRPEDFPSIHRISRAIYPDSPAWSDAQLTSHLAMFPEGQLVAEDAGEVVGMAASLVVLWDDYSYDTSWREFTDN